MSAALPHQEPGSAPTGSPDARPEDVVTGFWLWAVALPLMVTGYVTASLNAPDPAPSWIVLTSTAVVAVNLTAVVITLLVLLREGYRWARTLLTGGGAASVVYAVTGVLGYEGPDAAAVVLAITSIVGSVLIAGGIYLLHRKDAGEFFTR
ncbi:hypothetical protein [Mycolicibacterium arenosum]|uniref:Transmembrane protein n=1 Tax=Mycolicibacterium arenosum TaxID=2952157 RepID=A0ABT1M512_9MYCO|nr:hypothetical protein [Mycolicibacterium sp. CAU 1645]MCP9274254.1 hypothetical protein [Mycolicibacterium sp. CAU 1645]